MNVLFVVEHYLPNIGGIETMFSNFAKRLVKAGHNVTIVTHRMKKTKKEELIDGARVIRVAVPHIGERHWFSILGIPTVIKHAKNTDIIHTTTFNAAFPAAIAAKIRKKPSVITVAEFLNNRWRTVAKMGIVSSWIHATAEKVIARLPFDRFAACSEYTVKTAIEAGVKKDKLQVVYDGLDSDVFQKEKHDGRKVRETLGINDEFVYVYFGRAGVLKGVEYLLNAVPKVKKQIPDAKLLLILSPHPRKRYDEMLRLIKKLKIHDSIILLPPRKRDELPSHILAGDCVVVPSLTEGFGLTMGEACLLDMPVVITAAGAQPEVVWGKVVKVKPGDADDLARGIVAMAKKQYEVIPKKEFSWDKMTEEYLKIYSELIS